MIQLRTFISVIVTAAFSATLGLAGALMPAPAWPQDGKSCPGNPDALGTSRVLAIDPAEYPRVGLMQYPQTLPLADKEVVLTFDDGPLPPYSNQVLDILAAQCVKATYFLVGEMAHAYPAVVRRMYAEGHTIGTHTATHPLRLRGMPIAKLRWQIDEGIAEVSAALGDATELAPFFRIPGLMRTDEIESELAARSLVTFSTDALADDWHHRIKPAEIIRRAMSRLQARGKGILLLHDIHRVTVEALPGLLKELKEQGFHVVHVVPAAPRRVATAGQATSPTDLPAPWAGDRSNPAWPKAVSTLAAQPNTLPVPDSTAFETDYRPWREAMLTRSGDNAEIVVLGEAGAGQHWPSSPSAALAPASAAELPAPSLQDTGIAFDAWQVVGEAPGRQSSLPAASETGAATAPTSAN